MYLKKNLFMLFVAALLVFSACQDGTETAKEANKEILNDNDALSTDLVNNPKSIDNETVDASETGMLVFADTLHDFGNLTEGEVVQYEFEYINKGSKPVIITSAKGSCGCTVPEYDSDPIPPGKSGIMKVTFNSGGKPGYNEKSVHIVTNAMPATYQLVILAKVN